MTDGNAGPDGAWPPDYRGERRDEDSMDEASDVALPCRCWLVDGLACRLGDVVDGRLRPGEIQSASAIG